MKFCKCPRCAFFATCAIFLADMGDIVGANAAAAEVTVIEDNNEGYTDAWSVEDRTEQARDAVAYARDSRQVN